MANLHFLEDIREVSSVGLTVLAQALTLDDLDPFNRLKHPIFFPYSPTQSVRLSQIRELDYRPVSSRREWDAPGRFIPDRIPEQEELEMVPVEAYDAYGERYMQYLEETAQGNAALVKELVRASVPGKAIKLIESNYRRLEIEAMEAWAMGQVTATNPTTGGDSQTFSLGFDADRLTTAGTAWDDGGVDAYDLLLAWLDDCPFEFSGIVTTKAILAAIRADAPNPIPGIDQTVRITRGALSALLAQEYNKESFSIMTIDDQADVFDDGGTAFTRTRIWPDQYTAAVPSNGLIGKTYRAPVARLLAMRRRYPAAAIDSNGMGVFYLFENDGKTAKMQAQANWLTLPDEHNIYTIDTGVATA